MSMLELVPNMPAEAIATEFSKEGGKIVGDARKNIEATTNKPVITGKNANELNKIVSNLITDIANKTKE